MPLRNRSVPRSYALGRRMAAGGMGEVYEATAPDLARRVAIKRVLEAGDSDEEMKLLFLREVAVAATLEHQNVVEVIDAGGVGADLYLVMEFVEGPSLAEMLSVLRSNGRVLPVELAIGIASNVAHGLAHAHERAMPDGTPLGIVHRDIAPENVLIGLDGVPKLVDFGLAKIAGHSLTQPGVVRGRPRCLSPEQARGETVDGRSDIFSLGAMLFEMISGYSLYPSEQMATLLWKVAAGDYEPIARRMPGADPDLINIINTSVAPEPGKRWGSARRMIRKLDSYRAARGLRLSSRAIAQVVAAVWPSVQSMRSQAMNGSRGELEGARLSLPSERDQTHAGRSGPATPATPVQTPNVPPPRVGGSAANNPLSAGLMSSVGNQSRPPDGSAYPKPKRAEPAGWAEPLPVPEAPAKGLSFGPNETAWMLYFSVIALLAIGAFVGIWTFGGEPTAAPATAEARAPSTGAPR